MRYVGRDGSMVTCYGHDLGLYCPLCVTGVDFYLIAKCSFAVDKVVIKETYCYGESRPVVQTDSRLCLLTAVFRKAVYVATEDEYAL